MTIRKTVKIAESGKFKWINVAKADRQAPGLPGQNFHLSEADLNECPPPLQRPKLVSRPGYLFMILLFPVYNRRRREIDSVEVDFFIGPDFLVTVHENEILEPLKNFFQESKNLKASKANT